MMFYNVQTTNWHLLVKYKIKYNIAQFQIVSDTKIQYLVYCVVVVVINQI